jgi:hypothetical protein
MKTVGEARNISLSLGEHVPGLFVAKNDFVDRLALVLERDVVAVDVRGKEYF